AVNQAARNLRIRLDEKDHVFIRALDQKLSINVLHGRMEGADSLPVHEELLRLLGTDCFAVVPLHFKEKRIGVLVTDNFINRRPIGREDIKFLETFAYQASSAIENSRLYKELREKLVVCQLTNQSLIENQEKLLEAERLAAVGKMAAALAHEIRNPLVSIGGFARSLLKDLNAQDPRHEPLSIISSEVQRLESIVNEVLGYARLRKPTMAHGDLNELLRHSLEVVGGALERQEIEVQLETDPALPPVRMDESQMPQVLINILLNAIQAMPDGGTLRVRSLQCDPFVEIQVSDTGCGIPREIQDRLFQAFFTTKPTGSGLGLTVASQIIHQHRGSITVESEIGKGSTFTIRLPLTWTEEEAKAS
ncbi:MAG: GAF domain-containing protein, partial [Acidobacteria bacterium]|nr:GAF domain-containing protein [Acidobacteriota bacterium]